MKKTLTRLGAIILALTLVLSISAVAFADDLSSGVSGAFTDYDSENPSTTGENSKTVSSSETVNIKKELIAFNPTDDVNAPAFTYVYTVTPAAVIDSSTNEPLYSVTDAAAKHATNAAVTVPVQAGITTGLVVNSGTAGDASSAVGTLAFTNSTVLDADSDGQTNSYNIPLDFSGVTFTKPGVYRYQIAETLDNSATYAGIDVEDGGTNTLYLDVYVDGNLAIYGFVCMTANGNVTTSTTKTNGFVADSNGADSYYTYDLTISKDVVNDSYAESTIAFPFTVIFNNTENFTTTYTITETAGSGSTGITPAAANAPTWSGVARVKDGGAITYHGIPCGVDVDVYETNIATGVTYNVSTSVNSGAATTDNGVTWGGIPASAVAQTSRAAYESTKATVDTTATTTVSDAVKTIAITNTFVEISPTGIVVRVAPFVLIMAAGIVLVLAVTRRRREVEE